MSKTFMTVEVNDGTKADLVEVVGVTQDIAPETDANGKQWRRTLVVGLRGYAADGATYWNDSPGCESPWERI